MLSVRLYLAQQWSIVAISTDHILSKENIYVYCWREQAFINVPTGTKLFDILGQIWVDIGQKRLRFHIVFFFRLNSLWNVAL